MNNHEMETRLDFIEFRQQLLFDDTSVDRCLFEYNINRLQYKKILDLMDEYRDKIEKNQKVTHGGFEQRVYEIVPQHQGNYHFVEYLTQCFRENGRYEEIFESLYGDMPKHQQYMIDHPVKQ